jgi:hypothetical protein
MPIACATSLQTEYKSADGSRRREPHQIDLRLALLCRGGFFLLSAFKSSLAKLAVVIVLVGAVVTLAGVGVASFG